MPHISRFTTKGDGANILKKNNGYGLLRHTTEETGCGMKQRKRLLPLNYPYSLSKQTRSLHSPYCICSRKTKKAKLVLGICLILLLVTKGGYALQPPPPPLSIAQLKMLIAEADLIVVGKIIEVKEIEGTLEATLSIEELLKGKADGNTIGITETYKVLNPPPTAPASKAAGEPPQMIVRTIAGPSTYHGKYKNDARIVVLLEKIEATDKYRPLGAGTYNKHLGEFLIEDDGIKSIEINYFRFAEDVGKYTGSEKQFLDFIKQLIKSNSNKGGE